MTEPKGWHSRGYLPHLDQPGLVQFVTFHLADSLPAAVLRRIIAETPDDDAARCRRIERYLDAGHGACWLRPPEIATLVQHALLHFDGTRCRLLAWVVMPNHVHALIETLPDFPPSYKVAAMPAVSVRLPEHLESLLDQEAQIAGRARSEIIREALTEYIRQQQHRRFMDAYVAEARRLCGPGLARRGARAGR